MGWGGAVDGAWASCGMEQVGRQCTLCCHVPTRNSKEPQNPNIKLQLPRCFEAELSYLSTYQIDLKTFKFSTYGRWAFVGAGTLDGGRAFCGLDHLLSPLVHSFRHPPPASRSASGVRTWGLEQGFPASISILGKLQGLICILAPSTRLLGKRLAVLYYQIPRCLVCSLKTLCAFAKLSGSAHTNA